MYILLTDGNKQTTGELSTKQDLICSIKVHKSIPTLSFVGIIKLLIRKLCVNILTLVLIN